MITNDFLEQACNEVGAYTDELMMAEFDQFFQEQPAICGFVAEATSESEPKIQELSLFLSYMVFKAMKSTGKLPVVTPEIIEAAYLESESWIERMSAAEDPEIEDAEPNLIQYIIAELNGPLEDGQELEDEEKGEVFFVLKTVITSLSRRTL